MERRYNDIEKSTTYREKMTAIERYRLWGYSEDQIEEILREDAIREARLEIIARDNQAIYEYYRLVGNMPRADRALIPERLSSEDPIIREAELNRQQLEEGIQQSEMIYQQHTILVENNQVLESQRAIARRETENAVVGADSVGMWTWAMEHPYHTMGLFAVVGGVLYYTYRHYIRSNSSEVPQIGFVNPSTQAPQLRGALVRTVKFWLWQWLTSWR